MPSSRAPRYEALGVHASVIRRLIKERRWRPRSQIEINQLLAGEKTDGEHRARCELMRAAKAAKARFHERRRGRPPRLAIEVSLARSLR